MGILSMKGEKIMKKSASFGNRVRKRLSDITNMNSNSNHKSPFNHLDNVAPVPVLDDSFNKDYVQQLIKENAVMMKLLQEKDKILESNGEELQKLTLLLRKTQLQNFQLAQTNTQMLEEINVCKDRLKVQQHDIACKDALYKAKMLNLQGNTKMQYEKNNVLEKANVNIREEKSNVERETKPEKAATDKPKQADDNNGITVSRTKRGRPMRSQSLGASSSQQDVDKEIADNKRRCLRRQSIRLNPQESHAESCKIDVNTSLNESLEQPPRASNSETKDIKAPPPKSVTHSLPQRSSIGRPSRKAAEKIQSYKDMPLNTKMRRP